MIETNLTATRQKDHFKELLELSQQSIRNALSPKGSSAKVPIFYHTNHNGHKKGTAISRRLLNYSYGSKTTASLFGCSECTKFLDKYADLVWIDENKNLRWVLWDFELPEDNDFKDFFDQEFMTPGFGNGQRKPILKVSRPLVLNHFSLNNGAYQLGTASNVSNEGVEWEHFHMRINKRDGYPLTYINTSSRDYDLGVVALRRDVVAGILDLINLHRAKHVFENNSGLRLKQYNLNKINYLISLANQLNDLETSYPVVIAELMRKHTTYYSVKNTVLGVFLISLNTKGVDWALREYKEYTGSEVYMRPTREVADAEIERGEKLVTELGYSESLSRRTLHASEVPNDLIIWKPKEDENEVKNGGVFDALKEKSEPKLVAGKSIPSIVGNKKMTLDDFIKELDKYTRIFVTGRRNDLGVLTVQSNLLAKALLTTGYYSHAVLSKNRSAVTAPEAEVTMIAKLPGMDEYKEGAYKGFIFITKIPSGHGVVSTQCIHNELLPDELRVARHVISKYNNRVKPVESPLKEGDHYAKGAIYLCSQYNLNGLESDVYAFTKDPVLGEVGHLITLV